ncbi:hypothetical protein KKG90_09870 [Candidatus Bipolaricaulota bacterium]|nr:hypothetical protein [Candidatus Bipolaricaulota bacterium]
MKLMRLTATILLLMFVVATVGTLIAQEVARPEPQPIAGSDGELPGETPAIPPSEQSTNDVVALPIDLPEVEQGEPAESEKPGAPGFLEPAIEDSVPASSPVKEPCVVEATYFHNTSRCVTCLKIEGDAKAIVEAEFADQIATGKLRWVTINMEDERAYISQYGLVSPSLVLIRKVGDEVAEWVLLEETWGLVRSTTRYSAYIIDSFSTFLESCP